LLFEPPEAASFNTEVLGVRRVQPLRPNFVPAPARMRSIGVPLINGSRTSKQMCHPAIALSRQRTMVARSCSKNLGVPQVQLKITVAEDFQFSHQGVPPLWRTEDSYTLFSCLNSNPPRGLQQAYDVAVRVFHGSDETAATDVFHFLLYLGAGVEQRLERFLDIGDMWPRKVSQ
jgi:hypothetical protein